MDMEQGQQYTFYAPSVSDMINGLRHGTAPQISQGLLSPAPKSGIDTMNEAASAGMNNASQEHFQQKQAQQEEAMNNIQRRLAQGLLESKAQWQQGNMLANEGQDEQTRLAGANLMQQAANSGAAIRKSAESAGVDLSGFGSDVSYEDALQNFTSDTVRGLNKIFNNDMSSDEYYNQTYRTLRDRGYGESVSRKVAAEKAGEYQAQRISRLQDAFQNYGLSDRNSLNSDGVRLVNMMLQEDGNIANSLANMYANPKMDYTTDVGRENMSIQNQMAMEQAMLKDQMAIRQAMLRGQVQQALQAQRHADNMEQAQYNAILKAKLGNNARGNNSDTGSKNGSLSKSDAKEYNALMNYMTRAREQVQYGDHTEDRHDLADAADYVKKLGSEGKITHEEERALLEELRGYNYLYANNLDLNGEVISNPTYD